MSRAAACFLLLGLASGAPVWAQDQGCSGELDEARRLLEQNETASAIESLGALLGRAKLSKPCRGEALLALAEAQEKLGYYEESAAHWRELLGQEPRGEHEVEVLRGLARLEKKLGNLPESLKLLERLAALQPESVPVVLDMVETAQAMDDELGAVRRLIELRQKSPSAAAFDLYQRFDLVDAAVDYLETLHAAAQATLFERMELSRLYQERGQLDKALSTAQALEKDQPDSAQVQALLGALYLMRGELDRSVTHYESSLDKSPGADLGSFLEGLGEVFFQKGERDKAVRLWGRIVQSGPLQVFQKLDLARIYREHGLHDEALALLLGLREDRTLSLPPHLYVRQLADTYYITGQTGKALSELLGLVEQDPSQLDLMESELQRMLAEDMETCDPLAKLAPVRQSWAGHLFLAQGLEFCGKRREATWNYLQAHLSRNQLGAVASLFSGLVRDGHHEEAAWLETHLQSKSIGGVHLLFYRARLAEATGKAEAAEKLYRDYLAKGRKAGAAEGDRGLYDDALYHLGGLLLGPLKRPEEAVPLLTDLITRFPQSTLRPEAEKQLGLALYRGRQTEEAIRHLDAVGPTNPLALELLGQIQFAAGEVDKARVTLRSALAQYPEQLGSQPGLLTLLEVLRLMEASKEESALVVAYRHALLLEDWNAAKSALLQLGQHEAWKSHARFEMAQLAERQGRKDEAIEIYASLTAPDLPDWLAASAALSLDTLLAATGQVDRAITVLEKLILEHPKSPRINEVRQKLTDRKASAALRQQATP